MAKRPAPPVMRPGGGLDPLVVVVAVFVIAVLAGGLGNWLN